MVGGQQHDPWCLICQEGVREKGPTFLEVEGLNKMPLLIPGAQNRLGFLAEQPEAVIGFQEHTALSFLDLKQQDQTDLRYGTEFAGFLWDSPCPSGLQGGEAATAFQLFPGAPVGMSFPPFPKHSPGALDICSKFL